MDFKTLGRCLLDFFFKAISNFVAFRKKFHLKSGILITVFVKTDSID